MPLISDDVDLSKKAQCRGKKEKRQKMTYPESKKIKSLHKACWKLMSELVRRKRDIGNGVVRCYTCNTPYHWKDMDAGHFEHGGSSSLSLLDFHEDNLRPQCTRCNQYLSGNMAVYKDKLVKEIGIEGVNNIKALKQKINTMTVLDYEHLKVDLKYELSMLDKK